jgi:hypothetical protein
LDKKLLIGCVFQQSSNSPVKLLVILSAVAGVGMGLSLRAWGMTTMRVLS